MENPVGRVQESVLTLLPKFQLDCNGWSVNGDFLECDYTTKDRSRTVIWLSKELLNWTDAYSMEIARPEDALYGLMIVLALDAVKCSQSK